MKFLFPFKTLRTGLLLTYLVLIAVSLGLMSWRIGSSLVASRFAETRRDQQGRAILAASVAAEWLSSYQAGVLDPVSLQDEASALAHEIGQPVAILDAQGKVLADTENADEAGHNDTGTPEISAALAGQTSSAVRFDPDEHGDALFTVAPVRFQRELIGFVRIELPMRLIAEAEQQLWMRIIGATTLAAVATIVVSLLFARALSDPIARISRAAHALARGDLKQRVRVWGPRELEQLAETFNFMAERISNVMEDQRAFVADAAHELRTPLTTIRLRAEALSEGAKDDPQVATQFLDDITNETERLARLVDELLDLSRIETGLVAPRRETLALPEVARAVLVEMSERAAQANIALSMETTDALPSIQANPDQIRRVFINLIGNALKFTPAGGKVDVTFAVVSSAKHSSRLPAGRWIVSIVHDTGGGIPPDDLPHIFERFYRSDKARARVSEASSGGAGLGLAIVKSIVEAHGGRVWAESEKDKGTSLAFALPAAVI
ncbi:MAG: ATP-binding protein [Chloroflexota bacterium]